MADGQFTSLVSKNRDANALINPIYTQLSDGTSAIGVTSGALDVNISTQPGADLDIRDIDNAQDDILIYGWDGVANQKIKTDAAGELQVDVLTLPSDKIDDSAFSVGSDTLTAIGYLADETTPDSVDEGDIGVARMTLDRKQIMVIADATVDSQRLAIDSAGLAQVDVAAHALTNSNPLPVSKDNSANSETNPIFVQPVTTAISGQEIHDYDVAVAVASDSTSNHDYAVTGTTFFLKSVIISGSGNIKAEIQAGPTASLVTKAVVFLTGRQGDTKQVDFNPPIEVPITATGIVRVIKTNRQGTATDLYSTIIGNDV